MTLRDLAYVCAVARHGHFGRAAELCHVSQPTLSGQIRKLETELGVALFERTNKTVRLTAVGRQIVELAERILDLRQNIEATAAAHRDPFAGPFQLGVLPTIAPALVPLILERIWTRWPLLQVSLVEALTDQVTADAAAGDLDAAVIATVPMHPALSDWPLYDEPFFAVFRGDHPLVGRAPLPASAIDPRELLLLTEGHCLRDQALSLCGAADRETTGRAATIRATSLETILSLVRLGKGVTLIPALAVPDVTAKDRGLVAVPLADPDAVRTVRLLYRNGYRRMPVIHGLAELIRETIADRGQGLVDPIPAETVGASPASDCDEAV